MFSPSREPSDDTNKSDKPNRGGSVVHRVMVDRVNGRKVKGDAGEEEVEEAENVQHDRDGGRKRERAF